MEQLKKSATMKRISYLKSPIRGLLNTMVLSALVAPYVRIDVAS